jgi:hypothetical protein
MSGTPSILEGSAHAATAFGKILNVLAAISGLAMMTGTTGEPLRINEKAEHA